MGRLAALTTAALLVAAPAAGASPAPLFASTSDQVIARLDTLWRASGQPGRLQRVSSGLLGVVACYSRSLCVSLHSVGGRMRSVELDFGGGSAEGYLTAQAHLLGLAGGRAADAAPTLAAVRAALSDQALHRVQTAAACIKAQRAGRLLTTLFSPGHC